MTIFRERKAKTIAQPSFSCYYFSIFLYTITQNSILSRKLIYKHENSGQFPCLYHISRFPTAFSVKPIRLSAKTDTILPLFTFPFYTITETPDFCVKVYFCLIVRFFPLSPSYQRPPKTRIKRRPVPRVSLLNEKRHQFLHRCPTPKTPLILFFLP